MNRTDAVFLKRKQDEGIENARQDCIRNYGISSLVNTTKTINNNTGLYCPAYFDGILCWPPTESNSISINGCPLYVTGFEEVN